MAICASGEFEVCFVRHKHGVSPAVRGAGISLGMFAQTMLVADSADAGVVLFVYRSVHADRAACTPCGTCADDLRTVYFPIGISSPLS